MKSLSFILIWFIWVNNSVAQKNEQSAIQIAISAETLPEITEIQGKYSFVKKHTDPLNDGITQTNWLLYKKRKSERVGLLTLSIGNTIVYSEAYNIKINDSFDDFIHETIESVKTSTFDSLAINLNHLIRLPHRTTFGYSCWNGGTMPREGLEMSEMVEKSDTLGLYGWLTSINPVRQAYAYIGYKKLEAKGMILDKKVLSILSSIMENKSNIFFCSGCTFFQTYPISKVLADDYLNYYLYKE